MGQFSNTVFDSHLLWFAAGLSVTFFISLFKSLFEHKNASKKLFLENVTRERSLWRESLREEVAEFCALVYSIQHECQFKDEQLIEQLFCRHVSRLNELKVRVRLRVNPHESINQPDAKLVRAMNRVVNQLSLGDFDNISRQMLRIERNTQLLLKSEWDKSKGEAVQG
ncbi:hypothetical protein [Psychromonas aquimarina]|uniref:hypothetical protein n=1 Tax=Psychromonas aquimarina TaxID=444919 RepID=UPI00040A34C4|nr:hypothetical protein [Psychromonas aquimarina]